MRLQQNSTMNYKYTLDISSKKHTCPSCLKKRFVRYIDTESKNYLSEEFGRCDRESSCGYHLTPTKNKTLTYVKTIEEIQAISLIDPKYITASATKYSENNLFKYLKKHFREEDIAAIFNKYKIGTSKHWKGATVFWQQDQENRVRTGKIMLIDAITGKRVKKPFPHIQWVHKVLNLKNFNLKQCLFGEHLIKKQLQPVATKTTIAICESEKTAITMSLFIKDTIWIATGSKQNLKRELLQPLKNYNILLFPDCGEFEDWNKKAMELNSLGYTIRCSALLENHNYTKGTDLADVYFELNEKNKSEIINEFNLSDTEKQLQQMIKINPALINLIETFDLIDNKGGGIRTHLLK